MDLKGLGEVDFNQFVYGMRAMKKTDSQPYIGKKSIFKQKNVCVLFYWNTVINAFVFIFLNPKKKGTNTAMTVDLMLMAHSRRKKMDEIIEAVRNENVFEFMTDKYVQEMPNFKHKSYIYFFCF